MNDIRYSKTIMNINPFIVIGLIIVLVLSGIGFSMNSSAMMHDMSGSEMSENCDSGVCADTSLECLTHCLATGTLNHSTVLTILLPVFQLFLPVIIAALFVLAIRQIRIYFRQLWYSPRYIFETVKLLE